MLSSFKLRSFFILLLATLSIILSNRFTSQYFLKVTFQQQSVEELLRDVQRCQGQSPEIASFSYCLRSTSSSLPIEPLSLYYQVCDARTYATPACVAARRELMANRVQFDSYAPGDFTLQAGDVRFEATDWLAVYTVPVTAASSTLVLVDRQSITMLINNLWDLRDSLLAYTLPFIVLSVALAVWLMVSLLMRPVRALQKSMQVVGAENIDLAIAAPAQFTEFQSFVDVFNSLSARLSKALSQSKRFAADASHELKTPLTVLRGRTEALVAHLKLGSEAQAMALEVVDEIDHMSEIVDKLLLLSKADAKALKLDRKTENFSELLNDFLSDAASYTPDLNLTVRIQPDVLWVCDAGLIQILVQNLFNNAVKYNVPGGWVQVTLVTTTNRCVLTVENAANGLPTSLADNAFARFYRLDDSRASAQSGHGLGLSICREIADVHQAELEMSVYVDRVALSLSFETSHAKPLTS